MQPKKKTTEKQFDDFFATRAHLNLLVEAYAKDMRQNGINPLISFHKEDDPKPLNWSITWIQLPDGGVRVEWKSPEIKDKFITRWLNGETFSDLILMKDKE